MQQRIGAAAAVVGPLGVLVLILLRPLTSGEIVDDPTSLREVADHPGLWVAVHLGLLASYLVTLVGLAAIRRALTAPLARQLGRLAFSIAAISAALLAVGVFTQMAAIRWLAESWVEASPLERAVFAIPAETIDAADYGFVALWFILLGATAALFGLALTIGVRFPLWLGVAGVVVGVLGAAGGLAAAFASVGSVRDAPLPPFALLTFVWMAIVGVALWLRAGAGVDAAPSTEAEG